MSKGAIKKSTAQAICDAVKVKEGTTEGVPFKDVAERILAIPKAKSEQEKNVEITENGTTEITADEGYTLSKVTANVAVGGGNKFSQLVDKSITEVTAQDWAGVTKIAKAVFNGCDNLITVTLPDSVSSISDSAFFDCGNLDTVYLPDRAVSFGSSCFQKTPKLKAVHIKSLSNWFNSLFFDETANPISRTSTVKAYLYVNNEPVINLVIPNDVTKISKYAMPNYDYLQSVYIPSNVKEIDSGAFSKCKKLSNVTIEEGLLTIGGNAFSTNSNSSLYSSLTSIVLPNTLTTISSNAFKYALLSTVRIGNGITTIDSTAFSGCATLKDIYIDRPEDSISGAPWGATNATVHWNTPLPSEEA